MALQTLVLVGFSDSDLPSTLWSRLRKVAGDIRLLAKDSADLPLALSTAEGVVLRLGAAFDAATIDRSPGLRYIGMYGTGYGRIDTSHAARRGIVVTNVPNYSTEGVAELFYGILLTQLRELRRAEEQARNANYSESTFTGSEIAGKTLGILGLGNIGRRVAEIAVNGFHAKVLYWSRTRRRALESDTLQFCEANDLLSRADVVSLHLALTPETTGFLNRERLCALRPGSLLINLSPMELLDMTALCERLQHGSLTFVLDHSDELSAADATRLAGFPNCTMYPPIAYTTYESTARKQEILIGNVEHFADGTPSNKVN